MVRFARAEGSKACNKKVLEDATPWEEMVAQAKNDKVKKKKSSKSEKNIESEIKSESAANEQLKKKNKSKAEKEINIESNNNNGKEELEINKSNEDMECGDTNAINETSPTNDEIKTEDKKKRRKKKKGTDEQKPETKQEYKTNAKGQRVKVFKDGKEKTWFDLPYEDGERMSRFKNMWVKRDMVAKLGELEETLKVEEQDSKVRMRKMMKAIRKAHKELRIELIYEQRDTLMKEIRAEQGKGVEGKKDRKQKQAAVEKEKKLAKIEKKKQKKLMEKQKTNISSNTELVGEKENKIVEEIETKITPNLQSNQIETKINPNLQSNQVNSENDNINIQNESINNKSSKVENVKKHTTFGSDDETVEEVVTQNDKSNNMGFKRKNSDVNNSDKTNRPQYDLKYEENDIMTEFEGWWVKKDVVPKLTAMQNEKIRKIFAARADRNNTTELNDEERLILNRFMKKAKRGENRQLKMELVRIESRKAWKESGEEIKIKKKAAKPGKDLGITYEEGNDMVKFDGFWVKKESADRLNRLRGRLQSEGISDEELKAILQRERRKEERLLKNERKLVCFNCRQMGHMVSACPNVMTGANTEDMPTICYKCGSTEHMARECQVTKKGSEFSHATCFICHEAGHISRECPDNPRGLYPQGGGCKHCGSVEHLWRDCPDHKEESETSTIKVKKIDGTDIEALDDGDMEVEQAEPKKKKAKVINFD